MRTTLAFLLILALPGTAAAAEYVPSWILVQLEEPLATDGADEALPLITGHSGVDAMIARNGVHRIDHALGVSMGNPRDREALRRYGLDRTYRFHVPEGSDVEALVQKLSHLPGVEYAEPDHFLQPHATTPTDPMFPNQWALQQPSDADVDAPEGWDISTGSPDVVIAFIDGGLDVGHEEFVGKQVAGWNFDDGNDDVQDIPPGHGSSVSSVAAANANNGHGIAGVCWGCRIMPLKAGIWSDAADALTWATDNGARVVNLSAGSESGSVLFTRALAYAYDAGIVVVVSAGNGSTTPIQYPARYLETIALGASDSLDARAAFSNYGALLDVVAPGDGVLAATSNGGYGQVFGTSFAAPMVAGLAGLIESVNPSAGREEVRHLIRAGAEDQVGPSTEDVPGFDHYHGWGRVNLHRTLEATEASLSLRVEDGQDTRIYFETANALADSYDFIRGDLASLSKTHSDIDLGDVVCLEDDSPDADTAGNEDTATPGPGEAFFYLARFNAAPGAGSYGGSSRNVDRRVVPHWPDLAWSATGNQAGALYGASAASAGDVNGDGWDDVIVSAQRHDQARVDEGAAYLYFGSPSGLSPTADWSVYGGQMGARFGRAAASAGDVNGDGWDDLIIGAPYHDGAAGSDVGRVVVYHGSASVPSLAPDWELEGTQQNGHLGWQVSSAGDVNGDGWDDVIIGEPLHDGAFQDSGQAHVYLGSPTGLQDPQSMHWTVSTLQGGAKFGISVAGVGDVDCDGWDDVAIGAEGYDAPESNEGAVFLYYGSSTGLGVTPGTLEINNTGALFGTSVAPAGDVNGDSCADIVVGAKNYSNGENREGGVFVFLGSATGIVTTPDWHYESNQEGTRLGISASTAGDLNNDGHEDLVVGADQYDGTRSNQGRASVFLGSAAGFAPTSDWYFETGQTHAAIGWRVAGAGNVNGDAYDDLIIGADYVDAIGVDEGGAFVFHGPLATVTPPPTSGCNE